MAKYERVEWNDSSPLTPNRMQDITDAICDLQDRINNQVLLIHNCQNCGATLEVEENKPIFHCKYCGSAYVIGANRVYSKY